MSIFKSFKDKKLYFTKYFNTVKNRIEEITKENPNIWDNEDELYNEDELADFINRLNKTDFIKFTQCVILHVGPNKKLEMLR